MWQFFSVRSFYYGVAIQSSAINVPPLSIVKICHRSVAGRISFFNCGTIIVVLQQIYLSWSQPMRGALVTFIAKVEGVVKENVLRLRPKPRFFCPLNKNSWRRHCMHATSRHGTPSLTSLPKDGWVSCFGRSSGRLPIQFLTVHSHAYLQLSWWNWLGRLATHP